MAACVLLAGVGAGLWAPRAGAAPPVVSKVRAAQRAGTELVDVYYDLAAGVPPVAVAVQVSADGGASYAVPAVSLSGDHGPGLLPGANMHLVWDAPINDASREITGAVQRRGIFKETALGKSAQ